MQLRIKTMQDISLNFVNFVPFPPHRCHPQVVQLPPNNTAVIALVPPPQHAAAKSSVLVAHTKQSPSHIKDLSLRKKYMRLCSFLYTALVLSLHSSLL